MKQELLNIDHKMLFKGKENWNHRFYLLFTLLLFSYQGFQEVGLSNLNPFHSLWKNKL